MTTTNTPTTQLTMKIYMDKQHTPSGNGKGNNKMQNEHTEETVNFQQQAEEADDNESGDNDNFIEEGSDNEKDVNSNKGQEEGQGVDIA